MDTDQYFGAEATFFFVVSAKGRPLLQLRKGLCPSEVVLLYLKIMNPLKMKYKGAAPIWEWPPSAIFIYFLIVTIIAFHEEIGRFFRDF